MFCSSWLFCLLAYVGVFTAIDAQGGFSYYPPSPQGPYYPGRFRESGGPGAPARPPVAVGAPEVTSQADAFCYMPTPTPFARYDPPPTSSEQKFPIGFILRIECTAGLRREGAASAQCIGRQWRPIGHSDPPKCVFSACNTQCTPRQQCIVHNGEGICVCKTGFFKVGSQCLERSMASPAPQLCSSIRCPENSRCFFFRRRSACICEQGHFLYRQTCPRLPVTAPKMCKRSELPSNVKVEPEQQEWKVDAIIRYRCSAGLVLRGERQGRCLASGKFDLPPPRCIQPAPPRTTTIATVPTAAPTASTTCNKPQDPANGGTLPSGKTVFKVGEVMTFYCNNNYLIAGDRTAACQIDGTFTKTYTTCTMNIAPSQATEVCPLPVIPVQGSISNPEKKIYSTGDTVAYSCNQYYTLVGERTISCQSDGSYSAPFPLCVETAQLQGQRPQVINPPVATFCVNPPVPLNARIVDTSQVWQIGQEVLFACNQAGYILTGDIKVLCQNTGQFTQGNLVCSAASVNVGCPQPNPPTNGEILDSKSVYAVGEYVKYNCKQGYNLVGSETATCQGGSSFSANTPLCIASTINPPQTGVCRNPDVPVNGKVLPEGKTAWEAAELILYECNKDYTLKGIGTRLCQADGTIFGNIPTCEPKTSSSTPPTEVTDCTPQPPEGGYIYSETGSVTFPINTIFEYRCNDDARLDGIPRNMCLSNGELAVKIPACKKN